MAGEARTQEFNFSNATVMIGPMADVMNLTPEAHSIGLVRNINVTNNVTKTNLNQGIQNVLVHSTITGLETLANMEIYEYTPKNMAYALGLEVDGYNLYPNHELDADVTGDGLTTDSIVITAAKDLSSDYPVGSWVLIRNSTLDQSDLAFLAKVSSRVYDAGYDTLTVELDRVLPVGFNFKAGDIVCRQNQIPVGKKESQEYYGMKITAELPEKGNMVMIIPKVQIREGFQIGLITDNYSNMPAVFECFEQVPTDPMYDDTKGLGMIQLYMGGRRVASV